MTSHAHIKKHPQQSPIFIKKGHLKSLKSLQVASNITALRLAHHVQQQSQTSKGHLNPTEPLQVAFYRETSKANNTIIPRPIPHYRITLSS